jgi:hypothetical protein
MPRWAAKSTDLRLCEVDLVIRRLHPSGSGDRIVDQRVSLPFLLPWPRLTLLIRRILSSQWDEATWPIAKLELVKALQLRSVIGRTGWWN